MGKVSEAVLALGEEEFIRRMEGIPSAERREVFGYLDVPRAGASASARQRTLRRIRIAWERFGESPSEEAAETAALSVGESSGTQSRKTASKWGSAKSVVHRAR